jgi:hypothetical protein
MSASPVSLLNPSSRSLEWLVGPDALLSSTALSTSQLSSLGPIASLIEGAVDPGSAEPSASQLPDTLDPIANQIILDTHAQLEDVGHEVAPLNGPLHGLTNLGETIGLGHLGESGNLLTDLGSAAANPTGIDAVAPLLSDAGHVTDAAGSLLDAVSAVPVAGNGLVGTGGVLTPATEILNQAVLDLHTTLEDAGHQVPVLNTPIHAVTGLGETVGLGHIGEAGNLLTDTLAVPGSILNGGGLVSANPVLADLGHVLGATDTLIGSVTGAANAGGLLSSRGLLAPVTNLANTAVLDVHMTLENLGHEIPLLNDAVHGLTNFGETVGLGHLGESGNLLTDAAALPGALLDGQGVGALSPILGDVGAVTSAAGGLLSGVAGTVGDLGGGAGAPAVGNLLTPVTAAVDGLLDGHSANPLDGLLGGLNGGGLDGTGALLGSNAPLQPVGDVANVLIDNVHATLEQVGHDVSILNDPLHAVISLGNTAGLGELGDTSNLLTDAINLPGAILTGNAPGGVAQVVNDVGHVADALGGVVGSATGILDTAGGGGLGAGTPGAGILAPVTSALGGLTGGYDTGPLDGLLGGLNGGAGSGVTGALLGTNAPLQPVGDVANTLINGVHATLEQAGHDVPALNDPLHSVINLGNTAGLGQLGESSNLLTDVVNLPGAVLTGDGVPAATQLVNDAAHVADATGSVLGSVAGIVSAAGTDGHGTGTSLDGVLTTVTTALGSADTGAAGNPVGDLLVGLTGSTSGEAGAATHPLIDVSAGPATASPLADLSVLTPSSDPAHTVQVSAVAVGADQPSLASASLLSGVAGQAGGTTEGNAGTGTHPLIEVSAGPTTATPVAEAAVLTPSADPTHAVQVSAIGVSGDQPSLVTANLLSSDGIVLPQTSGGADQLVGHALNSTSAAEPASNAGASHDLHVDLGTVSIDLGGHTNAEHTDPTPHTATSGLHLLGL